MSFKNYLKRGIEYVLNGIPNNVITPNITYCNSSEKLCGKRIVITGGGHGLGFAMAKKFKEEGASVLIAGRKEDILKRASEELNCHYLKLDVSDVFSFSHFLNECDQLLGGIDCLVNNAGISLHEGNIENVSIEQYDQQFNTNLRGPYFLSKKFIQFCIDNKNNDCNILFVSSERGKMADNIPYGLTKAAINSLIEGLAYEYIHKGIRVNGIAPGVTASEMTGYDKNGKMSLSTNMTGRVYYPEEVAEIACFLLSDISNLLNGQILVCNEGKSINFRR